MFPKKYVGKSHVVDWVREKREKVINGKKVLKEKGLSVKLREK